jgi:hypothetical protein
VGEMIGAEANAQPGKCVDRAPSVNIAIASLGSLVIVPSPRLGPDPQDHRQRAT